jgi:hypothetical protein
MLTTTARSFAPRVARSSFWLLVVRNPVCTVYLRSARILSSTSCCRSVIVVVALATAIVGVIVIIRFSHRVGAMGHHGNLAQPPAIGRRARVLPGSVPRHRRRGTTGKLYSVFGNRVRGALAPADDGIEPSRFRTGERTSRRVHAPCCPNNLHAQPLPACIGGENHTSPHYLYYPILEFLSTLFCTAYPTVLVI